MKIKNLQLQEFSRLSKNCKQIEFMLRQRQQLYLQEKAQIDAREMKVDSDFIQFVKGRMARYKNFNGIVQKINQNYDLEHQNPNNNNKFWSLNQKHEKQVQDQLRHLKEVDINIDNILNEQFDICNEIEELDQSIRKLLIKKQPNHIQQAEPLLNKKEILSLNLQQLKVQKLKLKSEKLTMIKQLLSILIILKQHRQKRLNYCKQRKLTNESMLYLSYLIQDLNQVIDKRQQIQQNLSLQGKLNKQLQTISDKIYASQREMIRLMEEQESVLQNLLKNKIINEQYSYFEQKLLQAIKINQKQLPMFLQRSAKFVIEEQEKKQQYDKLIQGITTTNQTIKIFEHIKMAIETQNRRKYEFLKHLQSLQKEGQKWSSNEQKINDLQKQVEKLYLSKEKLTKRLSNKVEEADLNAYKQITSELDMVETDLRAKQIIMKDMKHQLNEIKRYLSTALNDLSQSFKDIIREVIPQLRTINFSKNQGLKQFNSNIVMILKRLTSKD